MRVVARSEAPRTSVVLTPCFRFFLPAISSTARRYGRIIELSSSWPDSAAASTAMAKRMTISHLLYAYRADAFHNGKRSKFIEARLLKGEALDELSVDEVRNSPAEYAALFSIEGRSLVKRLYEDAMAELAQATLEEREDVTDGLQFLQHVIATGLWKYNLTVGEELEAFAREFDRLDLADERELLHKVARQQSHGR